jgi:hypothetical protein
MKWLTKWLSQQPFMDYRAVKDDATGICELRKRTIDGAGPFYWVAIRITPRDVVNAFGPNMYFTDLAVATQMFKQCTGVDLNDETVITSKKVTLG